MVILFRFRLIIASSASGSTDLGFCCFFTLSPPKKALIKGHVNRCHADKQEQFYFSLACFLLELIIRGKKKKTLHLRDEKHAGFFFK